jgi:Bacterial inner membrane protein
MADAVGWAATAVFTASYFFRRPATLRRIQAAAACLWIAYGLATRSLPVVVANLLVATAAVFSLFRGGSGNGREFDGG